MDAMDVMDTNGHVFMDRMDTRTAGDVLEPVHSSIKRKVHRIHPVHDVHFLSMSMKMNENALCQGRLLPCPPKNQSYKRQQLEKFRFRTDIIILLSAKAITS